MSVPPHSYPSWAIKLKQKGQELRHRNGKYYLCEVSSKYDPILKRAKKITGEYLGRITEEDGLIPKVPGKVGRPSLKAKPTPDNGTQVIEISQDVDKKPIRKVKEFGATRYLSSICTDIIEHLKMIFTDDWQTIFTTAIFRLTDQAQLKNMQFIYEESYISTVYTKATVNKNSLTSFMQKLGASEDRITDFMNKYVNGVEHLLFDVTDITSRSKNISMAEVGYNSKQSFDPQVNLLYIFSQDQKTPVYYRIFPGNISGMSALEICIKESKVNNALIVADKGFLSYNNLDLLSNTSLKYILPLKRKSCFIDYSYLNSSSISASYDNYFIYNKRPIFYKTIEGNSLQITETLPEKLDENKFLIVKDTIFFNQTSLKLKNHSVIAFASKYPANKEITDTEIRKILQKELKEIGVRFTIHDSSKKVVIFYDKRLEVEESSSYLVRLNENMEDYSMESYLKKEKEFGSLSMITNDLGLSAEKIYVSYKTRGEIETVFDSYKNLLDADRTYMQSDKSLNAWMFINHLALMMYYRIFNILKSKNYLKHMSVQDVILRLSKISALMIDGKWACTEINSKTGDLLKKIGIDITEFIANF